MAKKLKYEKPEISDLNRGIPWQTTGAVRCCTSGGAAVTCWNGSGGAGTDCLKGKLFGGSTGCMTGTNDRYICDDGDGVGVCV